MKCSVAFGSHMNWKWAKSQGTDCLFRYTMNKWVLSSQATIYVSQTTGKSVCHQRWEIAYLLFNKKPRKPLIYFTYIRMLMHIYIHMWLTYKSSSIYFLVDILNLYVFISFSALKESSGWGVRSEQQADEPSLTAALFWRQKCWNLKAKARLLCCCMLLLLFVYLVKKNAPISHIEAVDVGLHLKAKRGLLKRVRL